MKYENPQADSDTLKWSEPLLWFTMAISCIVFIEPAPYDFMLILLFVLLYSYRLRVPGEIAVPALLLALFTAGNLVGALVSGEPDVTVRPLVTRIYMALSWLLFVSIIVSATEKNMRIIWSGYTVAALFAAVWGCLEYYDLMPAFIVGDAFGRAKGPFKDPNVFGPFLIPIAIYLLSRMLKARHTQFFIEAAKFLVIAFGILLSFSRGAWLNFGIALASYMLLSIATTPSLREKIRLTIIVGIVTLVSGATLTWAVNNTAAGQRFFDRAKIFKQYDIETGGRFHTQAMALEEVGSRPLGIGPGMSTPEIGMEPHNLFLHAALEGGWLGAVAFGLFLVQALYRAIGRIGMRWPLQSDLHVVLAVLLGTLFQSLFIDSTHWRHLWLLLAMIWGLTIAVDRATLAHGSAVMLKNLRYQGGSGLRNQSG
ncbi:MAG: O-antigen ligase family protein [Gammaproteobacteria bacterium]|nr:O-antigen ligase family protein [Gammaproteobacteria bacterium]